MRIKRFPERVGIEQKPCKCHVNKTLQLQNAAQVVERELNSRMLKEQWTQFQDQETKIHPSI